MKWLEECVKTLPSYPPSVEEVQPTRNCAPQAEVAHETPPPTVQTPTPTVQTPPQIITVETPSETNSVQPEVEQLPAARIEVERCYEKVSKRKLRELERLAKIGKRVKVC